MVNDSAGGSGPRKIKESKRPPWDINDKRFGSLSTQERIFLGRWNKGIPEGNNTLMDDIGCDTDERRIAYLVDILAYAQRLPGMVRDEKWVRGEIEALRNPPPIPKTPIAATPVTPSQKPE